MIYNPQKHHRRSIRLKGYDYSKAGLYFITLCCKDRACLFEAIENEMMKLNDAGIMVKNEWLKMPIRFTNIALHEYIIMPDHFHAILEIVGATLVVVPLVVVPKNTVAQKKLTDNINEIDPTDKIVGGIDPTDKIVGGIIGAFQSIVTVNYIRGVKNIGWQPFNSKLWQRNYWEHIIRNEKSYLKISEYIKNNPAYWIKDTLK